MELLKIQSQESDLLQTSLFKTSPETPYRLHWAEETLGHRGAKQETQGVQEEMAYLVLYVLRPDVRADSWKHSFQLEPIGCAGRRG